MLHVAVICVLIAAHELLMIRLAVRTWRLHRRAYDLWRHAAVLLYLLRMARRLIWRARHGASRIIWLLDLVRVNLLLWMGRHLMLFLLLRADVVAIVALGAVVGRVEALLND